MSSFVAADYVLLGRHAEVTPFRWSGAGDVLPLMRALRAHDVVFSWFLSHHAAAATVAARAAGKPSIAVLGGIEPADPTRWGGSPLPWRERAVVRRALNGSDLVLAVSHFSAGEALGWRAGRPRSELRVVPNGIDTNRFRPGEGPRQDLVLTVAVAEPQSLARKRVDLFLEAARASPHLQFVLVGAEVDRAASQRLRASAPGNAEIAGELPDERLLALYQQAAVYVQASVHESFGMANAEAMACGAVPVVTRAGALPEVVGDAGIILPEPVDARVLSEGIARALRSSDLGLRARERIVAHYDLRRREEALVRALEDTVAGRLVRGRWDAP